MTNKLNFIDLGDNVGYVNPAHIVSIRKEYRRIREYRFALALIRIRFCNGTSAVGIFRHSATTSDHPNFILDIDSLEDALSDFVFYDGKAFDLAERDNLPYMLDDMSEYIKEYGDIVESPDFIGPNV